MYILNYMRHGAQDAGLKPPATRTQMIAALTLSILPMLHDASTAAHRLVLVAGGNINGRTTAVCAVRG